ncbi:fibronectin type III domain-containing protein 5 isoform X2 [Anabrus simplex]|uniref:fibronectin type III domain-containing protein 5 isoform X2 n=1 Tax=Anabrus simplex TaxID=316456 RepID=UPI0034DDB7DC
MLLLAALLLLQGARLAGSSPGNGKGNAPENITVTFENATSVCISWSATETAEKYDVIYKPIEASYRVVTLVAGNLRSVTLHNIAADTQYQVTVTATRDGRKYRSRPIVFKSQGLPTVMPPPSSWAATPVSLGSASAGGDAVGENSLPDVSGSGQPYLQVRGVEVGIVLLVLVVWIGAIALFFNRWGKIRMLLPYQPDYKEQLKVPGSAAGPVCQGQAHSSNQSCPQHLHWSTHQRFDLESWSGRSRPRVNSAIFISSAPREAEFVQHQPFRSDLCRRTRSAENIPLSGFCNGEDNDVPILSISVPTPPENLVEQHL